jgi:polar amino acid transport system substrate-binding protein
MLSIAKSTLFICIIISINCLLTSFALACELSVRTYHYPPFAMKNPQGDWYGIDIDSAKVLLDKSNCHYTFVEMPWGRGMMLLKSGKIDMMLSVTKLPHRGPLLHFVGPQRMETMLLVSKQGAMGEISSWQQMKKLKVSLMRQRGTFIGRRFEQLLDENPILKKRIIYLVDNVVNIDMIRKGRATGFIGEKNYLKYEFENNPAYVDLQIHPIIINKTPVYYAFSKASVSEKQIQIITNSYRQLTAVNKTKVIETHYKVH